MARLAYFSPLPPTPSGISHYSEVLLGGLGDLHEVDLYYDRRSRPPRSFVPALRKYPHDEYVWRAAQSPYDLNVYQMGNSLHHAYIHPFVFQYPGLLILHDLVIHHARGHVLLNAAKHAEYRAELEYCHPGLGRQVGDILAHIPSDFTCYQFPMNKTMVDSSLAVGVHTSYGVEEVRVASPGREARMIRMGIERCDRTTQPSVNLEGAWPILASFGFITREKRVEACLKAVDMLRGAFPAIRYLLVGRSPRHFNARRLVRRMGLEKHVQITGAVSDAEFDALMRAATIVLNLRYPSAREMSASLLRALGAGRVTLVSELLHLTDIPAEIAPRVDLFDEAESIARIVTDLLQDRAALEERGRKAEAFVDATHRPEHMLADYAAVIDAALAARPSFHRPVGLPRHLGTLAEKMRPLLPEGMRGTLRL